MHILLHNTYEYDTYAYRVHVKHFKEMNSNAHVGMTMVKKEQRQDYFSQHKAYFSHYTSLCMWYSKSLPFSLLDCKCIISLIIR